jgi:probable phosphoglycerate mutase
LTTIEIRRDIPGWSVWTHPIRGGETVHQVGHRTDRVIARADSTGGTIALVAHSHLLRILAARWLGLPALEGRRLVLDTATMSILGWERENRVIVRWNDPCVST